jgi:hypothetical protein
MCEKVRALGTAGKEPGSIARALGVGFSTMQTWADKHPEFAEALDDAYHLARAHWEDIGTVGVNSAGVSSSGRARIARVIRRFATSPKIGIPMAGFQTD